MPKYSALKSSATLMSVALVLSLLLHLIAMGGLSFWPKTTALPVPNTVIQATLEVAPVQQQKPAETINAAQALADEAIQESSEPMNAQAFQLPPSAQMTYTATINGAAYPAGTVHWQIRDARYQLQVTVPVPFLGDFTFTSSGGVDSYGLAPEIYIEKRASRGERTVTLLRDQELIQFSTQAERVPLRAGTQDRFSVMFQLAGLVAGNPDIDQKGIAREIPLASINQLETWTFVSQGDVLLSEVTEHLQETRHFLRLPRDEKDLRRFEVWLAKGAHYLPVKMRQTDHKGQVIELVLSQLQVQ